MKIELPAKKVLERRLRENTKKIKIAVSAIAVLVAILFFGAYGDGGPRSADGRMNPDIQMDFQGEASKGGDEDGKSNQVVEVGKNGTEDGMTGTGVRSGDITDNSGTDVGDTTDDDGANTVEIICDISGAVKMPGIYILNENARLVDLIEAAGGLSSEADIDIINQARYLTDGEKVYIPTRAETEAVGGEATPGNGPGINTNPTTNPYMENAVNSNGSGGQSSGVGGSQSNDGRININTATFDELQKIPGVGPVTAEKIITYRESNGGFSATEELKNISGIGEKTYKKMEEYVTV